MVRTSWVVLMSGLAVLAGRAAGQDAGESGEPVEAEQPMTEAESTPGVYPVSRINIVSDPPEAVLTADVWQRVTVDLVEFDGVWSAAEDGGGRTFALREIGSGGPMNLDVSAVRAILNAVRDNVARENGLLGHLVVPASLDWRAGLTDLRADPSDPFLIEIRAATVGDTSVSAVNEKGEAKTSSASIERIVRRALPRRSLLRQGQLDDAVYYARRHPGRSAEAVVSAGNEEGVVDVDLRTLDQKSWRVFYQVENTGTDSTDDIRHRFGFRHNNLSGRDDILSIDYATVGFDESNFAGATYDFPVGVDRLRIRTGANYSDFEASDVGATGLDFTGTDIEVFAEARYTFLQRGSLFLDGYAGLIFERSEADNELTGVDGEESWLYPMIGVSVESIEPLRSFGADAELHFGLLSIAGADDAGASQLGRTDADADFLVARGSAFAQFWLEPFFKPDFGREANADDMTLAHELVVTGRWQASNARLIPIQQAVAGGLYTVRGYDEAFIAGDNMVIASTEYRYHFGRAVGFADPGAVGSGRFQTRRTAPYGSADWDLIAKGFFDIGYVSSVDATTFENDDFLASLGFGAELRLWSNVSARFDWGFVLTETSNGVETAEVGDNRVHFAINVSY